jgi:hypothetical protein
MFDHDGVSYKLTSVRGIPGPRSGYYSFMDQAALASSSSLMIQMNLKFPLNPVAHCWSLNTPDFMPVLSR